MLTKDSKILDNFSYFLGLFLRKKAFIGKPNILLLALVTGDTWQKEKITYFFLSGIGATIRTHWEIQCTWYGGFILAYWCVILWMTSGKLHKSFSTPNKTKNCLYSYSWHFCWQDLVFAFGKHISIRSKKAVFKHFI